MTIWKYIVSRDMIDSCGERFRQDPKTQRFESDLRNLDDMATEPSAPDRPTNEVEARLARPARLEGTMLFDHVRDRFCQGIRTLDGVLGFMKVDTVQPGSTARPHGIDRLLDDLIALARWLVGFLQIATACSKDSPWARSAIIGLRVELHQYSHKVMQIAGVMQSVKAFRSKVAEPRIESDGVRVVDMEPTTNAKVLEELEVFQSLGTRPKHIELPDESPGGL